MGNFNRIFNWMRSESLCQEPLLQIESGFALMGWQDIKRRHHSDTLEMVVDGATLIWVMILGLGLPVLLMG